MGIVLLFSFQGDQIDQPDDLVILLLVADRRRIYLNAGIAYGLNRALGVRTTSHAHPR